MLKNRVVILVAAASVIGLGACGSDTSSPGTGKLAVLLTDAPFPFDSVKSVDVFVVRVDARQAEADSAQAARAASDDSVAMGGWTTLANPNASIDLLTLRNGTT